MWALPLLSLATAAVASPLGQYTRALEGRVDVSQQDLSNFQHYVQHAGAAYCNVNPSSGDRITCEAGVCPNLEGDAVTVVDGFSGLATGIAGYVAVDHARQEVVLSVRGSNNIRNWITNIDFAWTGCPFVSECKVHKGFQAAWDEISVAVNNAVSRTLNDNPGYSVVATGHSLGGAVATLGAVYMRHAGLDVAAYSYGSPRIGNDHFANYVAGQRSGEFRLTHQDDPVPRLPPIIFGYRHVTPEYWLTEDASSTDYALEDIRVCEGIASISCNGGTFGLNVDGHNQYFIGVSDCSPKAFKAASTQGSESDISDEELEERLNNWSQEDQDFINGS